MNGRYCKSGLAFPTSNFSANCTAVQRIEFNNETIAAPYKCNPTNQSLQCKLVYNASEPNDGLSAIEKSFNVPCGCALDGNQGFCTKILGTTSYVLAVEKLKKVFEYSTCHSLDRSDMRAQMDECGIGPGEDIDAAIEQLFLINYWPYAQKEANEKVRNCIEQFFSDSPTNLKKSLAFKGISSAIGLSFMLMGFLFLE